MSTDRDPVIILMVNRATHLRYKNKAYKMILAQNH